MYLATAEQMKRLDKRAIEERGIPSIDLMERAAEFLAQGALSVLPFKPKRCRAAIFCGTGNNGGDGLAAARLLQRAGLWVRVFLVGAYGSLTTDALEMARRLSEAGIPLETYSDDGGLWGYVRSCQVIVDALFGVGLNRPIDDEERLRLIARINEMPGAVVAADIPSGIEADTGRILGAAIKADKTISFTLPKIGHLAGDGAVYTGQLAVRQIGVPKDLLREERFFARSVERGEVAELLPPRKADGHKGDFGKLLILAGSARYTGAPVLAARAATRGGCGLVTLGVPQSIWAVAAGKCMEEMPLGLPDTDGMLGETALQIIREKISEADAVLLGPGLGRSEETTQLVRTIIEECPLPLVLDADGINALEGHMDSLEKRQGRVTVLTPHDGEFARMGGDLSTGDRVGAARDFAMRCGCVLVCKGHRTLVAAPDGTLAVNTTGNSGMAKGGSGDVLAGLLASLLTQGAAAKDAAAAAVWLHGRAGDLCAAALTEYAMTPSDLLGRLAAAFREALTEQG